MTDRQKLKLVSDALRRLLRDTDLMLISAEREMREAIGSSNVELLALRAREGWGALMEVSQL